MIELIIYGGLDPQVFDTGLDLSRIQLRTMLPLNLHPVHHQIVLPHIIINLLGNKPIPLELTLQKLQLIPPAKHSRSLLMQVIQFQPIQQIEIGCLRGHEIGIQYQRFGLPHFRVKTIHILRVLMMKKIVFDLEDP